MPEHISAPYTFLKEGVFYFCRRVPIELRRHYTSPKIAYSLRTRSPRVAAARAVRAAGQLDEYWYHLRCQDADLPGKHMLRLGVAGRDQAPVEGDGVNVGGMSLSEAVLTYLRLKGRGKGVTFHRAAERSCGYVIDTCGDKLLVSYTKADANAFRDALIARGMAGSSITRVFGTVRSIINFAANEEGIELSNPFGKVYYDRSAGVRDRQPIPVTAIRAVQAECYRQDDDLRWLVALVADTGMRLAEAAGLLCEDIVRDDDGNYTARITPHPWRRLKTTGSTREVPLVGSAHWAVKRLLAAQGDTGIAFPRYNKTGTMNANAASASLNKWLKAHASNGSTMHGFRHSMRDRLRAVECPADIVDQIGGWQTEGVGHGYGKGYPVAVLRRWLDLATN
ncbi:DUF6538 domain-containing protein [Limimaricola litoreus]|uniref:Tyrosine-type recombinase/integrase n=1 Tax=Limimaricola litoreus TaxID=2955316 RepID=A0A9X2FQB5_9RHOB|nr:DUF6538 domain-containing protein [Limimaricola litoreus]MCP1169217.1 tyrosine-type recombinase/integrase [Limimaricola litoreus]